MSATVTVDTSQLMVLSSGVSGKMTNAMDKLGVSFWMGLAREKTGSMENCKLFMTTASLTNDLRVNESNKLELSLSYK
jgi:hypothetical protein